MTPELEDLAKLGALVRARGGWARLLGWLVDRKFVVLILTLLLIGYGLSVAPFDWDLGRLPRDPIPVDAIPDIGENQQIIYTRWPGRSPRDVEDQITYPLTTALMGIPGVRTVRSSSMLGFSTIYVIFEDEVDFYWSRSRVLEKLASLPAGTVPEGVTPTLGPDATALGQIYWYTLEGRDEEGRLVGGWDLHELRSVQDWLVRYALSSTPGVSEVASIGGFVREYQVDVDPEAMQAHGVTLAQVAQAVRESNLDVGARTIEINRVEYLVRGLGFIEDAQDLEEAVVAVRDHTPIRVADVAHVGLGPAERRGALDDAGAQVVGGVVVARYRENPMAVIRALNRKIADIGPGLPRRTLEDGTVSQITIVPFYDRSQLIEETLGTLSTSLLHEILITILVVLVLLRDLRSSLLISAMLPLGVLMAFAFMKRFGVDANIMALGGIAIAIGTMVDMGIVFTENIAQRLKEADKKAKAKAEGPGAAEAEGAEAEGGEAEGGEAEGAEVDHAEVVKAAAGEVAPAVVTSVLTTVVSFLPVFGLTASEARLFTPLAYTKTFAMIGALLLSLFVLPTAAHLLLANEDNENSRSDRGLLRVIIRLLSGFGREVLLLGLAAAWLWLAERPILVVLGAALVLLGLARLILRSRAGEGAERWHARAGTLQLWLAVAAVTLALAEDWMPLGPHAEWKNLLFVGGAVALLLGSFTLFAKIYPALLRLFLRHKLLFLALPAALIALGILAFRTFGREYMPPFDEGAYLYMPTTMPHASIGEALEAMQEMDAAIAAIPEVDRVVGKLGRAESALDPAPVSMIEAIVTYLPEYRTEADGTRVRQWRDHIRSPRDIWDEIVAAAERPGLTSAPVLMPINARIVMLQSGMRAPMGIKVSGPDLESIEAFGLVLEGLLREVPGVRAESVFAERVVGKPYLEIDLDREAIARYGLSVHHVQEVLQIALGGMTLSRSVEGRERYPIRVRYLREERDSVEALARVLVPAPGGEQIPLGQLAELRYARGPQVIRSEDTFLTSYVLFDKEGEAAEVEVVEAARAHIEEALREGRVVLPPGVSYRFAGSYENQLRSEKRLTALIPIALALVFLLLYLQFRRVSVAAMIYTGVAVAVSGAFLLLWLYGQPWFLDFSLLGASMRDLFQVGTVNLSVAVWVGVIALIGVATDDGVVMATYLEQRFRESPAQSIEEIRARTLEAGRRRVRACLMTTATTILALLPVITSQGRGADVMVPMALPSVGGMTIELITLFVVPVLYCLGEEWRFRLRGGKTEEKAAVPVATEEPSEPEPEEKEKEEEE